ncbi:MAG: hypothetical protein V4615_08070 [Bacteroidota bacterium]
MKNRLLTILPTCFLVIITCFNNGYAQQRKVDVETTFKNILQIGKITLSANNYQKLQVFLSDTFKRNNNIDESGFFLSQEFLDFSYSSEVFIYGYTDWKEYSGSVEDFAKKAMVDGFGDTVDYKSPLWHNGNIPDSLRQIQFASTRSIGKYLGELGYALCNIDCDCDCYRLVLIRPKDLELLQNAVTALGCQLKLHEQEW